MPRNVRVRIIWRDSLFKQMYTVWQFLQQPRRVYVSLHAISSHDPSLAGYHRYRVCTLTNFAEHLLNTASRTIWTVLIYEIIQVFRSVKSSHRIFCRRY